MLKALHAPADALVVMDAGIATEDRGLVARQRLPLSGGQPPTHPPLRPRRSIAIETRSHHKVHLHKVVDEDRGEVRLYCYSEERAKKEEGIARRFAERFESELRSTRGCRGPAPARGSTPSGSASGGQALPRCRAALHRGRRWPWKHKPLADHAHPSGCLLSTLQCPRLGSTDLVAHLHHAHRSRSRVRSLKSELGLRPIFHKTQNRSDGHLFITVIAYQLVQTIRRRLAEHGENASWTTLRRILQGQHRVTASFRRKDGRTLHVRKATRAEQPQLKIYTALDLHAPGGVTKLIV